MHGHPALAGGEIMRSLFSGAGQPCRLVQIVQDDRDRQERYNSGFSVVKMNSDISPRRTRRESNEIVKSNDPVGFRDCENEALPFYNFDRVKLSIVVKLKELFIPSFRIKLLHSGEPDSPRPFIAIDWDTRELIMLPLQSGAASTKSSSCQLKIVYW
jgi:hypothetical protein